MLLDVAGHVVLVAGNIVRTCPAVLVNVVVRSQEVFSLASYGVELDPLELWLSRAAVANRPRPIAGDGSTH